MNNKNNNKKEKLRKVYKVINDKLVLIIINLNALKA